MKNQMIIFMLATVLLGGCKAITDDATETRINHIGLYDFSKSVNDSEFIGYITQYTLTCFDNLSINDASINFPIDGTPEIKSKNIYYIDFSQHSFLNNQHIVTHVDDTIKATFNKYKKQQRDSILSIFKDSKKSRAASTLNTDIIRSLLLITKYIDRDTNKSSTFTSIANLSAGKKIFKTVNLITIFSDMINDAPGLSPYNMNGFAYVTHKKIDALLDQLQQRGEIANLKGCTVIVSGATGNGNNASQQYENIQYFWTGYFKKAGANLQAYGYDSSMEINAFFKKYKS